MGTVPVDPPVQLQPDLHAALKARRAAIAPDEEEAPDPAALARAERMAELERLRPHTRAAFAHRARFERPSEPKRPDPARVERMAELERLRPHMKAAFAHRARFEHPAESARPDPVRAERLAELERLKPHLRAAMGRRRRFVRAPDPYVVAQAGARLRRRAAHAREVLAGRRAAAEAAERDEAIDARRVGWGEGAEHLLSGASAVGDVVSAVGTAGLDNSGNRFAGQRDLTVEGVPLSGKGILGRKPDAQLSGTADAVSGTAESVGGLMGLFGLRKRWRRSRGLHRAERVLEGGAGLGGLAASGIKAAGGVGDTEHIGSEGGRTAFKVLGDRIGAVGGEAAFAGQVIGAAADYRDYRRGAGRRSGQSKTTRARRGLNVFRRLAGLVRSGARSSASTAAAFGGPSASTATRSALQGARGVAGVAGVVTGGLDVLGSAHKAVASSSRRAKLRALTSKGEGGPSGATKDALEHLQEIQGKRMKRAGLSALTGAMDVTAGAMALSGFGAVPGIALGAASAGIKLGRWGLGKLRQRRRDKAWRGLVAEHGSEEEARKRAPEAWRKTSAGKVERSVRTAHAVLAMPEDQRATALGALGVDDKKWAAVRKETEERVARHNADQRGKPLSDRKPPLEVHGELHRYLVKRLARR